MILNSKQQYTRQTASNVAKNCKKLGFNPENSTRGKTQVVYGLIVGTLPKSIGMVMDAQINLEVVQEGVHYWKWASKRRLDALLANTMSRGVRTCRGSWWWFMFIFMR